MEMNGSQRVNAPPAKLWAALNDVEVLKACIPGCEQIAKTSDTTMEALVTLRVGPVKASFKGNVSFSDIDPPRGYTIKGEGNGGSNGQAKGTAKVRLEPAGKQTILHYTVTAEVSGKLAQLGARLIDVTAKKLADDFFMKLGDMVAPPTADIIAEREARQWVVIRVFRAIFRFFKRLFGGGQTPSGNPVA